MRSHVTQKLSDGEKKKRLESSLCTTIQRAAVLVKMGEYTTAINNLAECIIDANKLADMQADEEREE